MMNDNHELKCIIIKGQMQKIMKIVFNLMKIVFNLMKIVITMFVSHQLGPKPLTRLTTNMRLCKYTVLTTLLDNYLLHYYRNIFRSNLKSKCKCQPTSGVLEVTGTTMDPNSVTNDPAWSELAEYRDKYGQKLVIRDLFACDANRFKDYRYETISFY